ncbi:MAG: hypothetical protein ABIR79_05320, partial [Candidatus Binatia bacterium]
MAILLDAPAVAFIDPRVKNKHGRRNRRMEATMTDDERALRALAAGGLQAISWAEGSEPDWRAFFGPYVDGAVLCPSARPATTVTPEAFQSRLDAQRSSNALRSLDEKPLGTTVQVFGNVAVVMSAFEAR